MNWFDTELDALHARKKPPRDRLAMAEEDDDNDFPEEEVLSAGQWLQASALSRVKWIGLDVSTTQETFDKESLVGKKLSVFRLSEEQSRLEVSGRGD